MIICLPKPVPYSANQGSTSGRWVSDIDGGIYGSVAVGSANAVNALSSLQFRSWGKFGVSAQCTAHRVKF
ncbi:hypothetical protein GCM10025778_08270 [Paeniglutamicibacter antarcticus]|uniref:Uncharacterized protein n=1 Tax=Paeniglutamicibacter antarcticus TaxID=494023 RepID=A0ABP9TI91_9MICC